MSEGQQETVDPGSDAMRCIAALASLPLDQRKVLTVAVATSMTYQQIAEHGELPPDQVLDWLTAGLRSVADALAAAERDAMTDRPEDHGGR